MAFTGNLMFFSFKHPSTFSMEALCLDTTFNPNLVKDHAKVDLMRSNGLLLQLKVISNLFPKYILAVFNYHKRFISVQKAYL